jgi:hypothetical protein
MNAASGRLEQLRHELGADVDRRPPRAEARSASCDRAPERSDTCALERAPALEHRDLYCARAHRSCAPPCEDPTPGRRGSRRRRPAGAARRAVRHVGRRRGRARRAGVLAASGANGVSAGQPVQARVRPSIRRSAECPRGCPRRATPAKFSRIEEPPRPSMYAARPARTRRSLLRASRSVVSTPSSVAQMNSPPCGCVQLAPAEVLLERLEHHVAPAAVEILQRSTYSIQAGWAPLPALLEVGRDEQLRDRRGAQVGALFAEVQLLEHRPRGDRPAEAQPRREDLRERAQVDHEVRGAAAPDRVRRVERVQRRQRLALVAQQPVGVVLEHQQLALARDLDQPPAARQRHRHAARVLEVGDRVDELRPAPLACRRSSVLSSSSIGMPSASISIWTTSAW